TWGSILSLKLRRRRSRESIGAILQSLEECALRGSGGICKNRQRFPLTRSLLLRKIPVFRRPGRTRMQSYIEDLKQKDGETVQIRGWVDNLRSSGKILFLIVRDGTGRAQCIVSKNDVGDEMF